MPVVRGPLFSMEAHGTLNGVLTYQQRGSKSVVKSNLFATPSDTDAQLAIRDVFSWAVEIWNDMHEITQALWLDQHDAKELTGYASFMNRFLSRHYAGLWQFEAPPDFGFCLVGNHLVDEFAVGGGLLEFS
jgi:hypothetical protein